MKGGGPAEYGSLIAQLTVADAAAAIVFYRAAFDAREYYQQERDGHVVHCELVIGLARFIVHDEFADSGLLSPLALGGTPVTLMHYVENVDLTFRRAVAAGAEPLAGPDDKFWGLRSAVVRDPFGHRWLIVTQLEDLSPQEIIARARAVPAEERLPMGLHTRPHQASSDNN